MIRRVAFLSLHTSPLVQPGVGDAGGMNVYIDELARTLTRRGIAVDVFTRTASPAQAEQVEVEPGYRVLHVAAGLPSAQPISALAESVAPFAGGVIELMLRKPYDLVHSHYWLSGWAGLLVKRSLGLPLVNSFHTLGRVKDVNRRDGQPAESLLRISAEHDVIAGSDCVLASTPYEAEDLVEHYGADPAGVCVTHPGVDHGLFSPGDREAARLRLGLGDEPLVLFAGRLQPLKGLDVAIEAIDLLRRQLPSVRLLIVGGPSGPEGPAELARLRARSVALEGTVAFLPPRLHRAMPDLYRAADVLVVPSRSESFGLVAAEAQACGLPVVAARIGGLAYVVDDGVSGVLVDGWDPVDFASALSSVLLDSERAARLGRGGLAFASQFSWKIAGDRILELYEEIVAPGREKNP